MTAWIAIVIPMCLLMKCGVDFIALEYGSKFQFIQEYQLVFVCIVLCLFAGFVDTVNFRKTR